MNSYGRTLTKCSAAKSVARLFSGNVTEAEAREIHQRMDRDASFCDEFEAATAGIARLDALADDADVLALTDNPRLSLIERAQSNWPAVSMAAALLIAITAGLATFSHLYRQNANDGNVQRYVTRVSEQKTVELADGSRVTLNTGSQILADISQSERRVTLVRGEVFFAVQPDVERPFIVDIGARSITVLGTEFNVLKLPETYRIAVVEGEIAIHNAEEIASQTAPLLSAPQGERVKLDSPRQHRVKAGWVAEYNVASASMSGYQPENMERLVSWRSGLIEFYSQPLYQVVKELNRYSARKILIEDASIMNLKVYAGVDIKEMNTALAALEAILPIKVTTYFDRIVIVGANHKEP